MFNWIVRNSLRNRLFVLAVAALLRISSLAALVAAALAAPFALATDQEAPYLALCLFMAVLIFIRHKDNIGRLLKGTEPRIGGKKLAAEPPQDPTGPA